MKKRTQHNSVSDMVRDLSEDQAFAEEFAERVAGRQLVKALTVLRTRAGLSQQELAQKLGCTQSKVSKLESSDDADVRFGDLIDYTEAVGYKMRIFLPPHGQKIVDEVQMYAAAIHRLLERMVQLAGEDGVMVKAAARFLGEAACNLTRFVQEAATELPAVIEGPSLPFRVETPGLEAEPLGSDPRDTKPAPKNGRRPQPSDDTPRPAAHPWPG